MAFDTALNIVTDAAVLAGLGTPAAVYTATDPNIVQMRTLLKVLGRWLRRRKHWTWLQSQYVFQTIQGQATYAKAIDYDDFINQTGWNRLNRLPMGGPLSPQQFEYYKARLVGVVWTTLFRDFRNNIVIYPDTNTPSGHIVAYEYGSSFWVSPANLQPTGGTWNNATTYPNSTYIVSGGLIYQAVQVGNGLSGTFGPTGFGNNTLRANWQQGTNYAAGARVTNGTNVYINTVTGASAGAPLLGPSGTGTNIIDGSCLWNFSCTVAQAANVTAFVDNTCNWNFIGTAGADAPTQDGDTLLFDPNCLTLGLKYAYLASKKMAGEQEKTDFENALNDALQVDSTSDILRMDRSMMEFPLLGEKNIPLTGFGMSAGS